ncbi:hypothetical protein CEQ90_18380 [Lewinellaceae bacterium SD302]|nr:hypothetical protein CEQ90_18380 [Lewinellaceae bacterium SD302]
MIGLRDVKMEIGAKIAFATRTLGNARLLSYSLRDQSWNSKISGCLILFETRLAAQRKTE